MGKIRVLHSLESVTSGGVEKRRLSLAQYLDPERYEQRLICTKADKALPQYYERAGCQIYEVGHFRGFLDFDRYRNAIKIVSEFRPHIIHGAVFEGVAMAAICGTLCKVPIIIGEETSNPVSRSWRGNLIFKTLAKLCNHMVAVSPAVEEYLVDQIGLSAKKVSLITNGVSESIKPNVSVVEDLKFSLGISSSDFIIGTVGRVFDSTKRISDIVRAMPWIIENVSAAKLVVVGAGPDEMMLKELAVQLKIEDRVFFVGYQAETRPYYEIMDVFVLASAREAFGLVLVEAMFSGLPVVATRVGGIPKVVMDGVTGLLCDPFSPDQLANCIVKIFENPDIKSKYGEAGKARARQYFSENRYVDDVKCLYEDLIAKSKLHLS